MERREGFVDRVCADRGFGFIAADGNDSVFFHWRDLLEGLVLDQRLVGKLVSFEPSTRERGACAKQIRSIT